MHGWPLTDRLTDHRQTIDRLAFRFAPTDQQTGDRLATDYRQTTDRPTDRPKGLNRRWLAAGERGPNAQPPASLRAEPRGAHARRTRQQPNAAARSRQSIFDEYGPSRGYGGQSIYRAVYVNACLINGPIFIYFLVRLAFRPPGGAPNAPQLATTIASSSTTLAPTPRRQRLNVWGDPPHTILARLEPNDHQGSPAHPV